MTLPNSFIMIKKYIPLVAASLIFASCGGSKSSQGPGAGGTPTPQVPTTIIEMRDITTYDSYPTDIEGIINSEVRAKIPGYITDVLVDEGQRVGRGQLLFKLETSSRSEDAAAAKANINAAQVRVNQLLPLVEQKIVSRSQLETAKAQLAQAKAAYKSIAADIGYANISSQVSGYVGEIRLRQGNLASPSDPLALTTISDISKVYAYFTMNEKAYLDFLQSADGVTIQERIKHLPKVTLIMANGEEYPYKGSIQTVNSQVNKSTGSVSFRAVFDNPERLLTNGSTGTIRIPKTYTNALVIPQQSTFESQDKILVMKIQKSGDTTKAVATSIETIDRVRGLYLVKSGLKAGDEIVVKGVNKLPDGSIVKPNLIPFDSAAAAVPVIFEK